MPAPSPQLPDRPHLSAVSKDIGLYSQHQAAEHWLKQTVGKNAQFACVLGFTETGLIPGISAAGATPADRQFTAIADAEFLMQGAQVEPAFPLPPLMAGASPVLISRAVIEALEFPTTLFNAGLPQPPTVPAIDLGGMPARCVSTGQALDRTTVEHLLAIGLHWGTTLAQRHPDHWLMLGECVVGGTTTALALLIGLGWDARDRINSSHPTCNHGQKWAIVSQGLIQAKLSTPADPLTVVAAVGDPMQIAVAGMAIAASRRCPVLLAGGTQMLAVHALMQRLRQHHALDWDMTRVVVGTTRWVAEDPTGDTVGLAKVLQAPLLATQLSFATAQAEALRAYEQGFVKEGVGAGGCAIAAHLLGKTGSWLCTHTEGLLDERRRLERRLVR
ncbi:nicotinate mononucleotide-dependent phosphoribosyltransferase CobT [Vacuolonema iberomarrocanum]|uniref:nicotinate mononucleotide-dependent phosphoribosyltransferase CobT n=1 Tax=Vacuolonema iberomarrocanum TaxID=3454632 RepID=UPI0019E99AE8|nr:TIGR00303 family protein [filamentous cyanobacterium LEGE 07170]